MSYIGNNPVFKSVAVRSTTVATSGQVDNLSISAGSNIRLTAATSLTGIVADSSGREVTVVNASGADLTLVHASGSSSAGNRLFIPGAANKIIPAGGSATFSYETGDTRWNLKSASLNFASLDEAEALTNKTIDADLNTITNIDNADIKVGAAIDAAKIADGSVDNTEFQRLGTAGTAGAGNLVTTDSTQTLTNKTLQNNLVDNYLDFNEESAPSTPASGTIRVYGKADGKMYQKDDSGNEVELGGGGGSGGRNYLQALFQGAAAPTVVIANSTSNRTVSTTDWAVEDALVFNVLANTTNPLRQTQDYLLSRLSGSLRFLETPMFQVDIADTGKPLSVSFDIGGLTASTDYDVIVVRYNSSGVYQGVISVAGTASTGTPASAQLPSGTTKFSGFFIPSATQTDYYSVRFRALSVNVVSFQVDSLFVGPQAALSSAAITDWQSYTPTGNWVTNTTYTGKWRRVGDSIELSIGIALSGAPTGTCSFTTTQILNGLGLTYDNTKVAGTVDKYFWGSWSGVDTGTADYFGSVGGTDPSAAIPTLILYNQATPAAAVTATVPFTWGNTDEIAVLVRLPIAQWSSNVTMGARAVEEFAFNTELTNVSDIISFGNGSQGASLPNVSGTEKLKRVRFQTPIQPNDKVVLEVTVNSTSQWIPLEVSPFASKSNTTGIALGEAIAGSTDINVYFGSAGTSASVGGFGAAAWSAFSALANYRWRVRKVSGGAVVGYPIGARNIVGDTTGTAVPTGFIGEMFGTVRTLGAGSTYYAENTTALTVAGVSGASVTLNKGVYLVAMYANSVKAINANSDAISLQLNVGGVPYSGVFFGNSLNISAGRLTVTLTLPVVVTTDNTTVQIIGFMATDTANSSTTRISAVRVG